MKYFAILGKNEEISLKELALIEPQNINFQNSHAERGANGAKTKPNACITFSTSKPELLPQLGGIIKRGRGVSKSELPQFLQNQKMLGTADKDLGIELKRQFKIKRFKLVETQKTDIEVKKKGVELITLGDNSFGIVLGYQNIPLYEAIDFKKPSRSMQMGMMPAKLTHILINIGLSVIPSVRHCEPSVAISEKGEKSENTGLVIYDPFAGSGTTGMLANAMGYDFIGSDIKIDHLQKNIPRRQTTSFYNPAKTIDFFQHNIENKITSLSLRGAKSDVAISGKTKKNNTQNGCYPSGLLIITEGRLGPIIHKNSTEKDIIAAEAETLELYKTFLTTISSLRGAKSGVAISRKTPIVTTIPHYFRHENIIGPELSKLAKKLGRHTDYIQEIYSRPTQRVGRKIMIFS